MELTASKASPRAAAASRNPAQSLVKSQGKCGEIVGVARTSCWIVAQSSILSSMPRGSPGPGKRAKRVPPVPTPQVGTATRESRDGAGDRLDVDAAASELARERGVVVVERGPGGAIAVGDEIFGDAEGHGVAASARRIGMRVIA